MKDYLKAARDAERRKAWDEATYFATMAAQQPVDVSFNEDPGRYWMGTPTPNFKGRPEYVSKPGTPPSKMTKDTEVFTTDSRVQPWMEVEIRGDHFVIGVDVHGEAYLYRCS